MAIKVSVTSSGKNRISINNQNRKTVRTVGIVPVGISNPVDTLAELKDVDASDADNNEILVYDEASGKYVVEPLPNLDGGTF